MNENWMNSRSRVAKYSWKPVTSNTHQAFFLGAACSMSSLTIWITEESVPTAKLGAVADSPEGHPEGHGQSAEMASQELHEVQKGEIQNSACGEEL